MNSNYGVKTNVGKSRRNRQKKASKDTVDKMKSITIADVENHTGVKTNVGKNRRNRQKKASKDTEETVDKMKSLTIADVENHTGVKASVVKKRSYGKSVGVKEKVEEVGMNSDDDDSDDDFEDSWGHDHSKCLEEQELLRAREQQEREHMSLLVDKMLLEMEMDKRRRVMSKMYKGDVEMVKRLEEAARCLKRLEDSISFFSTQRK